MAPGEDPYDCGQNDHGEDGTDRQTEHGVEQIPTCGQTLVELVRQDWCQDGGDEFQDQAGDDEAGHDAEHPADSRANTVTRKRTPPFNDVDVGVLEA